jgi:hypothetical protein
VIIHAGEKRKRKLQYLQQLIKDGSNNEQSPGTSPRQHEVHLRSPSADYETGRSSSPYLLPSHSEYARMSSNGSVAMGPASTATTASFDHHLLPSTQSFSPYASSWNSPNYDPPPPPNVSMWTHPVDYSSWSPPTFEQTTSSYYLPRELVPNSAHYALASYEHYKGSQSHTPKCPV